MTKNPSQIIEEWIHDNPHMRINREVIHEIFNTRDLSDINLSGTNLAQSDFTWADFSRANFENANLAYCNMFAVNLSRANLTGANLRGTSLHNTKWDGLTLREPKLGLIQLIPLPGRWRIDIGEKTYDSLVELRRAIGMREVFIRQDPRDKYLDDFLYRVADLFEIHMTGKKHVIEELAEIWG